MDIVLLLGAPGSGKGTVAARLAALRGFIPVSSGDMLRDAVARETPIGAAVRDYMVRGELVPDVIIGRMIGDLLRAGTPGAHYLLDGFPRTVPQLELLEKVLADCGGTIAAAVLIEVGDALIAKRIAGRRVCPACNAVYHVATRAPRNPGVCDACGGTLVQRDDDRAETVVQRLAVYHRQTAAVIDACAARNLLTRIDGTGGVDAVAKRILRILP